MEVVPSIEPLSTTTSSTSFSNWVRTLLRQASRVRSEFRVGTTTVTTDTRCALRGVLEQQRLRRSLGENRIESRQMRRWCSRLLPLLQDDHKVAGRPTVAACLEPTTLGRGLPEGQYPHFGPRPAAPERRKQPRESRRHLPRSQRGPSPRALTPLARGAPPPSAGASAQLVTGPRTRLRLEDQSDERRSSRASCSGSHLLRLLVAGQLLEPGGTARQLQQCPQHASKA